MDNANLATCFFSWLLFKAYQRQCSGCSDLEIYPDEFLEWVWARCPEITQEVVSETRGMLSKTCSSSVNEELHIIQLCSVQCLNSSLEDYKLRCFLLEITELFWRAFLFSYKPLGHLSGTSTLTSSATLSWNHQRFLMVKWVTFADWFWVSECFQHFPIVFLLLF